MAGCGSGDNPAPSPTSAAPEVDSDGPLLLAAGDIAQCDSDGDEATARLAEKFPGARIAALGDTAYPSGRDEDFERCWKPSWGRLGSRIWPAVGNHEYATGTADAYFRFFGRRAGPPGKGWHSYEIGAWHVVVLNSNCDAAPGGGCARGSEQQRWLRADLRKNRDARCTLAYMHHPPRSSGPHGSQKQVEPLRRALARGGADVLLAGHDHLYERFDPRDGLREWVVGTGGAEHYQLEEPVTGSRVRKSGTHGLLALTLRERGYSWQFLAADGDRRFSDKGRGRCA